MKRASIITREAATGKGPEVTIIAGEAVTGVPSQGHVVSRTVHDVHRSKEPLGMITLSCSYSVKQVYCSMIFGCYECFSVTTGDITMPFFFFFFFFAELQVEPSGAAIKGISLEEFLEKFAEYEEN